MYMENFILEGHKYYLVYMSHGWAPPLMLSLASMDLGNQTSSELSVLSHTNRFKVLHVL